MKTLTIALPSLFSTVFALLTFAVAADAQVLHVDDDAPNDPGPGNPLLSDPLEDGSTEHPYDRIQEAITAAVPGTEIRIAAGTYVDFATISLEGKLLWVRGVDGPGVTIVDATTLTDQVMQAISGETSATIVEGLTLRGGVATGATPNDRGAGLYINNSSLTVRDCILEGNTSTFGGALYMNGAADTVLDACSFWSNDALRGGAIYANASSVALDGCSLMNNTTTDHGGALFANGSTVTASVSSFQNNACVNQGGAIFASSSTMTLAGCPFADNGATWGGALVIASTSTYVENCAFDRNVTSNHGSAIYKSGSPTLQILRCRFTENDAQGGSAAVMLVSGFSDRVQDSIFNGNFGSIAGVGTLSSYLIEVYSCTFAWNQGTAVSGFNTNFRIRNSILWGNTAEVGGALQVEYSDVLGGYAGSGNIDTDPLFRNPLGADGLAGTPDDDFRLFGASPCIDAGDTRVLGDGSVPYPVDYAGNPRAVDRLITLDTGWALVGQTIDVGAYELQERCRPMPTKVN